MQWAGCVFYYWGKICQLYESKSSFLRIQKNNLFKHIIVIMWHVIHLSSHLNSHIKMSAKSWDVASAFIFEKTKTQRKSRNDLRSPNMEAENFNWTNVCCASHTKKLSNLTFLWEKILQCYHLFTFLLQPASRIHGFLPAASSFIWGHSMRPWSTGKEINCLWSSRLPLTTNCFPWWSV